MIEIANTRLEQDLTLKAEIYAAAGIQDYWVVDINTSELIVLRHPQGQNYTSIQRYHSGQVSPLAFPDLQILVRDLLA